MRKLSILCLSFALSMSLPADLYSVGQKNTTSSLKQNTTPETVISVVDNRLKVENAPIGSKLEIYSVVGIKVLEIEIKYSVGEYPLNIAKGYYIVRLGETVRKIVIR